MRTFLTSLLLALLTLPAMAQREGDNITITTKDGRQTTYNLTGTNNALSSLTFNAQKMGVVLKGLEDFGAWEEHAIDNIVSVTFNVYRATYTEQSAADAVRAMGLGFNFGNTLEANNSAIANNLDDISRYETCWQQRPITRAQLDFLHQQGFGAVRIPITWAQHLNADGDIDEAFMQRVEQVVDDALAAGLYCIINVQHDTADGAFAWIKADTDNHTANQARYKHLWTQIATRLNDRPAQLLFEAYNEMLDASGNWWEGAVSQASYDALNAYAQDFVDAVRATGGNNLTRNLVVTPYAAHNNQKSIDAFVIPIDPAQGHIIAEAHSYDPYDWINQHGAWDTQCQQEIDAMFARLSARYAKDGVPFIIGEFGTHGNNQQSVTATSSTALIQAAADQAAQFTRLAKQYSSAAFYWMNIFDGTDRDVPRFSLPTVVEAMKAAYRE